MTLRVLELRPPGGGGSKSLQLFQQDRCGSSLPINRVFFCFFHRVVVTTQVSKRTAQLGSETYSIAAVNDANGELEINLLVWRGWLGWPRPTGTVQFGGRTTYMCRFKSRTCNHREFTLPPVCICDGGRSRKPLCGYPHRGFESHPLRQPVPCFCGEILLRAIIAEYPQVRLT